MGKAVQRNRFRRQMKEIFRKQRANLTGASQILIMGRFSAVKADSSMLADDFLKLCRRARLLMESPPPLRE